MVWFWCYLHWRLLILLGVIGYKIKFSYILGKIYIFWENTRAKSRATARFRYNGSKEHLCVPRRMWWYGIPLRNYIVNTPETSPNFTYKAILFIIKEILLSKILLYIQLSICYYYKEKTNVVNIVEKHQQKYLDINYIVK